MAFSIDETYTLVKYISRKNNSAYLDPEQFNMIINRAQTTKFADLLGDLNNASSPSNPKAPIEFNKRVLEDIKQFTNPISISIDASGQANYPPDYVRWVRFGYKAGKNTESGTPEILYLPIEVVDEEKEYYKLSSVIVPPTREYPIVVFKNTYMQFYPINLGRVQMTYLRQPERAVWAYTMVNNRPVFNSAASVNLNWPDIAINDIVIRACSYIGISIKDADLVAYTQTKTQEGL